MSAVVLPCQSDAPDGGASARTQTDRGMGAAGEAASFLHADLDAATQPLPACAAASATGHAAVLPSAVAPDLDQPAHGCLSESDAAPATRPCVVLDTNIVLDVLLFQAPEAEALRAALQAGQLQWLGTAHMREELRRVLDYAHIAQRVRFYGTTAERILALRDQWVHVVEAAPRCAFVCRDADDQCFIDLAVAHGALLLSKDAQVLKLRKRLARQGVVVSRSFPPAV